MQLITKKNMETTINNYGTVIINGEPKRKTWKRSMKLGNLFITFSNCRVKKRGDNRDRHVYGEHPHDIKRELHKMNDGKCPICGQPFEWDEMELHHVLPWCRFPELRGDLRNIMLLCPNCHKEIHCDPFKNIRMMKEKADELGVNLEDRYATA